MKKQDFKDRMHEHEGMKHHLHTEHERHGHRMHQESAMHEMHGQKMSHAHGIYKNEVEKPAEPHFGHISPMENMGYGMRDWKGDADPIAYGQASEEGCRSDEKKIHSQFKDYHWD